MLSILACPISRWSFRSGSPITLRHAGPKGHARIESTYIYLDHLAEAQEIVDAAVGAFDLGLAAKEAAP